MDKQRPVILIVAVVLGITLGALGVFAGCMGAFSSALQSSMMGFQEQMAAGNPAMQAQLESQRALVEAQAPFQIPMLIGALFNLIASFALIIGAAMLAALKRWGATLLIGASVACALVDIFNGALGMFMTIRTQEAVQQAVAQMGQMPGQDPQILGAAMNAGGVIGIVMALMMIAVKLVVYAVDIWAARDATVQQQLS